MINNGLKWPLNLLPYLNKGDTEGMIWSISSVLCDSQSGISQERQEHMPEINICNGGYSSLV